MTATASESVTWSPDPARQRPADHTVDDSNPFDIELQIGDITP
jgi:hypothetical protein